MPKQTFFNLPSDKKEQIVETAYDLFIDQVYEDISIRDLTAAMGISIGSFYQCLIIE